MDRLAFSLSRCPKIRSRRNHFDAAINDQFMKGVAQTLQSDNAALFLLIRKMTTDKVLADLQRVGGTVLRTSFDHTKQEALRQMLVGAAAAQPAASPVAQ